MEHWLRPIWEYAPALHGGIHPSLVEEFRKDIAALVVGASRDEDGVLRDVSAIKHALAERGYGAIDVPRHLGGHGCPPALQAVLQFIAGYYDLDLRDAAHVGHGRLILDHGSPRTVARWAPRLLAGDLAGIAITEDIGGTNVRSLGTAGRPLRDGGRLLSGQKTYISRIAEAAVFVVFFRREGEGGLEAAVVPADAEGVHHTPLRQDGLRGWSWGRLEFDSVHVPAEDLLIADDIGGQALFTRHFDYYRPMVALTALGGAAAAFDTTLATLRERMRRKRIRRPLDSSLEELGRSFIQLQSATLAGVAAVNSVKHEDPLASAWARTAKAHGVETAYRSVEKLQLLNGASSFERGTALNKVLHDLRGYMYADGIHDAMLQSAGRRILHDAELESV